jgi:CDP-paratose 2-epimerase
VFNIGGGYRNTLSPLELLQKLEKFTGNEPRVAFADARPHDQKVYISDIRKAKDRLRWEPRIGPSIGVKRLVSWVKENKVLFG